MYYIFLSRKSGSQIDASLRVERCNCFVRNNFSRIGDKYAQI